MSKSGYNPIKTIDDFRLANQSLRQFYQNRMINMFFNFNSLKKIDLLKD